MKKVALISTYCDTQEKLDVLEKNIDNIKKLAIDVIVISPIFLPQYIQTKCDYFFLTKDNPVLEWPQKAMQAWKNILINGKSITITRVYADYGWAGLSQVKKLSELALALDYDYFYHMIYDLKFDETVIVRRLKETAYLNGGLKIVYKNEHTGTKEDFYYEGGIADYVSYLASTRSNPYPSKPFYFENKSGKVNVQVSFQYAEDDDETIYAFASDGTRIPLQHATSSWENGTTITSVDLGGLLPGNYFLVFGKDSNLHTIPFIKE